MNSAGKIRNAAYNDHQHSGLREARSHHVPSTFLRAQQGDSFEREIYPADSASNAEYRSATSSPRKTNGFARMTAERDRPESIQFSARHDARTRTNGPPKENMTNITPKREFRGSQSSGVTSRVIERLPISPPTKEKVKSKPTSAPWKPQISLLSHIRAPLACRTSIPPPSHDLSPEPEPKPLELLSADEQEAAILDDLLYVFMGCEGQYIRFENSYHPSEEKVRLLGPDYKILPGLDPSLRDLTQKVLKLAKNYSAMEAFVEVLNQDDYGAINHALSASIRTVFKNYLVMIAQLEHQFLSNPSFTLHQLQLHTLSMSQIMSHLYTLGQSIQRKTEILNEAPNDLLTDYDDADDFIEKLRDDEDPAPDVTIEKVCDGGVLLRLVTERLAVVSGDPAAKTLLETLLRDASRPYMVMLNEWLHHGGIKDPRGEFFIKEHSSIGREQLEDDYTDQYWEKRYTIRNGQVPPQFEAIKDKVLLAGKYLNVVRECGGVNVSKEVRDVPKSFDDPRFLDNINGAYSHANSSLLNLLLTTHGLSERLRSLKYYFFLDQSDFFTYFLDLSSSELEKPWQTVNVGKLQSLFDLVLRQPGSVAAHMPFKEDVKVQISGDGLTSFLVTVISVQGFDQEETSQTVEGYLQHETRYLSEQEKGMTGYETLQFKYCVPFPLSLVISSNALLRYQLLFRYLFSLRHLEDSLVDCWRAHHKVLIWTHRSKNRRLEIFKRRTWTLRAQMLVFVQQIIYHCTSEVIEPQAKNLMSQVEEHLDKTDQGGFQQTLRTVDGLMGAHLDFLDSCLRECTIINLKLLRSRNKTIFVCRNFVGWTKDTTRQLWSADPILAGSPSSLEHLASQFPPHRSIPDYLKCYDPTRLTKLEETLERYELQFHRHLRIFLEAMDLHATTNSAGMTKLCARLSIIMDKEKADRGERRGREEDLGLGGRPGSSAGGGGLF